jgi:hypothetical protein
MNPASVVCEFRIGEGVELGTAEMPSVKAYENS